MGEVAHDPCVETAIVGTAAGRRPRTSESRQIRAITRSSAPKWPGWLISHKASWSARRSPIASCGSGAADPALAKFVAADRQRRHRHQTAYVAMLLDNGPLREGLSAQTPRPSTELSPIPTHMPNSPAIEDGALLRELADGHPYPALPLPPR